MGLATTRKTTAGAAPGVGTATEDQTTKDLTCLAAIGDPTTIREAMKIVHKTGRAMGPHHPGAEEGEVRAEGSMKKSKGGAASSSKDWLAFESIAAIWRELSARLAKLRAA
mmetsp:Transcript_57108/g.121380  ORF Transcript_57108/g.121380 Transcript_57108/m.121380 type:complete len:111 (-) Transcript_57108:442-774(-)